MRESPFGKGVEIRCQWRVAWNCKKRVTMCVGSEHCKACWENKRERDLMWAQARISVGRALWNLDLWDLRQLWRPTPPSVAVINIVSLLYTQDMCVSHETYFSQWIVKGLGMCHLWTEVLELVSNWLNFLPSSLKLNKHTSSWSSHEPEFSRACCAQSLPCWPVMDRLCVAKNKPLLG
jgi:hypothetical protein